MRPEIRARERDTRVRFDISPGFQDKVRNLTGLTVLPYTHDYTLVEAIAHSEVLFLSQHANGNERGFLYADNATHHNRVPTMSLHPLNR